LKTFIIFLFFTFLAGQAALAQENQPITKPTYASHTAGLKAGINLSALSGGKFYLGLHAGIYGEERISKGFGYGGEANLNLQGGDAGTSTLGLLYFTVPLLANFYVGKTTFQVGPYGALLLSSGSDNSSGSYVSNLKDTDYGLTAGFKTRIVSHLGMGARYYFGIQDLSPYSSSLRNQNIQIGLTYDF
jgi:hypothetical protein